MTKKDYKIIAEAIKLASDSQNKNHIRKDQLLSQLIPLLKRDNPRFDGFKFAEACGAKKV